MWRPSVDNQSYYDAFAQTYEDRRDEGYHRFLDETELGLVLPHIQDRDVLEVGCGTGLILRHLDEAANRAAGIDLSPGMLEHAKRRGLEVYEADACNLPFEDATFDVACSFKVLAHVPDLGAAFREMARVVRPGGLVIAELYNRESLRTLVKRLKPATRIGRGKGVTDESVYTRYDTRAELEALLPPELSVESVDGFRIASPVAAPFNLPLVGPAWTKLERGLMQTPLKRFGGFLVLTLRRRR